jgi:hypothetical protein
MGGILMSYTDADKTIVFTVSLEDPDGLCRVSTEDWRGSFLNDVVAMPVLFGYLSRLTEGLGDMGYTVLFKMG